MQESDIKYFYAKTNGRISTEQITPGARENVFARVTKAERDAGSVVAEKIFARNCNLDNEPGYGIVLWLDAPSAGADYESFCAATQRSTAPTGSERKYSTAALKTNIAAGVSSAVFTLENAALSATFADADDCVLSKKPDGAEDTGTEEIVTLGGAPSLSGNDLTMAFAAPTENAYTTAELSRISALYSGHGDIEPVLGTIVQTGGGTIVLDANQVTLDNNGTMEQNLTVYFPTTDGTYTVTSDDPDIGTLASGNTSTDYAPLNAAMGNKPYISIPAAAWSGTPAAGSQFVIPTTPPAVPLYVYRTVPAASPVGYSVPQICHRFDY